MVTIMNEMTMFNIWSGEWAGYTLKQVFQDMLFFFLDMISIFQT